MLDDIVTFALNKEIGQRLLAEAGLPVPENLVLGQGDDGRVDRFLSVTPDGCVVKPVEGWSGRGVTCGVRTRSELRLAARRASGYSAQVLLERMVLGASYRVLLLDGELLDVVLRHPPRVQGDGRSTIAELVSAENRRRVAAAGRAGTARLDLDLDLALTLRRAGRTLGSVPADGELVAVKTAVGGNRRDDNERVRAPLHPDVLADCVRAAEVLGVRLAGVDLITTDPTRPLGETGGAINEVNTTPSLLHHVNVTGDDDAPDLAGRILARLLENAERGPFVR
jgi:cyanophycin synthetase